MFAAIVSPRDDCTLPSRTNQEDALVACFSTSAMLMRRPPALLLTGTASCRTKMGEHTRRRNQQPANDTQPSVLEQGASEKRESLQR